MREISELKSERCRCRVRYENSCDDFLGLVLLFSLSHTYTYFLYSSVCWRRVQAKVPANLKCSGVLLLPSQTVYPTADPLKSGTGTRHNLSYGKPRPRWNLHTE